MELVDKDLLSLQETRNLIREAKQAAKKLSALTQVQIDTIVKAIADCGIEHATELGKMASEETGFGKPEDKRLKNIFASKGVYDKIRDLKTVGILRENKEEKIVDIAVSLGVIAGLIPSTNPTSTVIYKAQIALKSGNSIIFSPHPGALKCILKTVSYIAKAAEAAGAPKGSISCISTPTLQATDFLMKHDDVSLILATGGAAMVKAAYSSGTPAIGVGPGNGPAYIEKTADIQTAVRRIMDSKTFDNGTICATEQSVIVESSYKDKVIRAFEEQGAYFLNEVEAKKLERFILRPNGSMNPQIVGQSVQTLAKLADLNIPQWARVLIAHESNVGHQYPYSREKLGLILAFYTVENSDEAKALSINILEHEGAGHTFSMHSENEELVREFSLAIPASRFVVNIGSSLGGVGATTSLFPALTLGCGAVGGSSTADNIGPLNLIDIRKMAYGVKEIPQLREEAGEVKAKEKSPIDEGELNELVTLIVSRLKNHI